MGLLPIFEIKWCYCHANINTFVSLIFINVLSSRVSFLITLLYFNFYACFFSKFTAVPKLDSEGNPISIDLNHIVKEGIASNPMPYKIRILRRA
jgi:hypothetical protein